MGTLILLSWWELLDCFLDGSSQIVVLIGTLRLLSWWELSDCFLDGNSVIVVLMGTLKLLCWWELADCCLDGNSEIVVLMGALRLFSWWELIVYIYTIIFSTKRHFYLRNKEKLVCSCRTHVGNTYNPIHHCRLYNLSFYCILIVWRYIFYLFYIETGWLCTHLLKNN